MRTPSIIRQWRTRLSDAHANRLRLQLAEEKARNRKLEQIVADLQAVNEGYYKTQYDAAGGPLLDPAQPFPQGSDRPTAGGRTS